MTHLLARRNSGRLLAALALSATFSLSACSFGGQAATALPALPTSSPAATVAATANPASVTTASTVSPATSVSTSAPTVVRPTSIPTTQPSTIPTSAPKTDVPSSATPVPAAPAAVASAATGAATGSAASLGSPRVLAWNRNAKQLAWYSAGASQPVLNGVAQATMACGSVPLWPSGDKLIVYHGGTTAPAQLVSLTDPAATPVALGNSSALGCDLGGHTAFSPDGKRLALVTYGGDSSVILPFASGTFRVLSVADNSEQANIANVNAFALENGGALLIHLIANSKNQADQADLGWWDAASNKERFLERSIKSSDKCFFISASLVHVADKVYTAFGENCTAPAGSAFRILRTDFAGGNSSNWVQHTGVGGNYFSYTNTNFLTVLPDKQTLLLAVPNGLKSRVANLLRISLADATVTPLISSVMTDSSPQAGVRPFLFNPPGTLLAFVTINPNNGQTLYVYDLSKPTQAPAAVTDSNRSNQITGLVWNAAGDRLIYSVTGDDSSLSYFDLTTGKNLVTRGIFEGLAVSADGATAATTEQVKVAVTDTRYNLVAIALADGSQTTLFSGDKGASALDVLAVR